MSRIHSVEMSFICFWLAGCIAAPEGEAPRADATMAADALLRRDRSLPPEDALDDATLAVDPDDLRTLDAGAGAADSASPDARPTADAGSGTDASAEPDAIVFAPRPPPADLCVAFDAVEPIEMAPAGREWHGAVEVALAPGRYHVDVPQPVDYDGLARFVAPETGHYYISFEGLGPSSQPRLNFEVLSDCQPAAGTGEGFAWPALTQWAGPVTQVTLVGGETLFLALTGATGPMDVVLRVDSAPPLPDDADCAFAPDLCPVGSFCDGARCTPFEPVEEVAAALVRWSPAPPGWPEEDIVALHLVWRGARTLYYQIEGAPLNGPVGWRGANVVESAWQQGDLHHGMARVNLWGEDPAALTWRLRVLFNPAGAGPWQDVAPAVAPEPGPEGGPCGFGWPDCADGLDCRYEDGRGEHCVLPDPTCTAPSRPVFVADAQLPNDDRHEATAAVLDGDVGQCPAPGAPAGAVFTAPQAGRWTFRAVEEGEQGRSFLCLSRGCPCDIEVCSGPGGAVTATLAAGESIAVFALSALGEPGVGLFIEARRAAPPFTEVHLVPNEVAGVALQLVTDAPDDLRAVRIEWLDDRGETRLVEVQPLDNGITPFGSAFWFTPQTREATRFPGARVEVATRDGLAVAPVVVALEDAHMAPGAPCRWGPVDLDCPAPEACVGPDDVARCVALEAEEWPAASLLVEVLGTSAWIDRPGQLDDGPERIPIWAQVRVKDAQGRVLGGAPGWRTTEIGEHQIWLGELSIAERRAIDSAELRLVAHDRVQAAVELPVVLMEPGQAGGLCAHPVIGIYPGCAPGLSCGWGNRCEPIGALVVDDARLTRIVLDGGAPGLLLSVRGQGASGPPFLQGHMLLAEGFRPLGFSAGFAVEVDAAGHFEGTAELFIDVPPEWVVGYRAELYDGVNQGTFDVPVVE